MAWGKMEEKRNAIEILTYYQFLKELQRVMEFYLLVLLLYLITVIKFELKTGDVGSKTT
jgi:hypothetical protein